MWEEGSSGLLGGHQTANKEGKTGEGLVPTAGASRPPCEVTRISQKKILVIINHFTLNLLPF